MASRGGRGGGRGGRGGSSGKPQLPVGHLLYADIIAHSKLETGVLYPPTEECETDFPSADESRQAGLATRNTSELKFGPFWLAPPSNTQTDIERYEDRFKTGRARGGLLSGSDEPSLVELPNVRTFEKTLLPTSVYEAVWDKRGNKRSRAGEPRSRKKVKGTGVALLEGDETFGKDAGSDLSGNSDEEEELEPIEDDEEEENDYDDNYFDNGEDDDGDAIGGGGGGDDDGGVFD